MYLTHIDENGNDSPAILIDNVAAANRAINIPEFVNVAQDGFVKLDVPAAEFYTMFDRAWSMELLRPLVQRWLDSRGEVAFVGADQFFYWKQYDPFHRIAPDVYVLPGIQPVVAPPSCAGSTATT